MPSTRLRQDVLGSARRVVVKMGTQLLTASDGNLDLDYLADIASQVATLRASGREVTLVCSGAVGAGRSVLGLDRRPSDVAQLQAVAAAGQPRLMYHIGQAFEAHDIHVAQLLLTRSDFDDRLRFLNIRNCIAQLHRYRCLPIVNENDTVAVDEIRFGDNDMLAALMCNALRAEALVLLFTKDGLLDHDGNRVDLVEQIDDVEQLVRIDKSALGTGGMSSKLAAARLTTTAGEIAVIANGREPNILPRLFAGEPKLGTVFLPADRKLASRQRWIGLTKRPDGFVTIDAGAATAITQRGKSLLATGITGIRGQFEPGALVSIRSDDDDTHEIARGMTNYSSDELQLIIGKRSSQFEKLLGRRAFAEVIHRDNLVLRNVGPSASA